MSLKSISRYDAMPSGAMPSRYAASWNSSFPGMNTVSEIVARNGRFARNTRAERHSSCGAESKDWTSARSIPEVPLYDGRDDAHLHTPAAGARPRDHGVSQEGRVQAISHAGRNQVA